MIDANSLLEAGGLIAIALVILAESGLLIGFFLPGDTILIPAGIAASQHKFGFHLVSLLPVVALAAIIGYEVGYRIGQGLGPRVFKRKEGLLFRSDYIQRTENFMESHGKKSMIIGRFIAVVRTLVPVLAGVGKMPKKTFVFYNIVGAVVWSWGLILASYWIGTRVSHIDRLIVPIFVGGIVLTVGAEVLFIVRTKESREHFRKGLRADIKFILKR